MENRQEKIEFWQRAIKEGTHTTYIDRIIKGRNLSDDVAAEFLSYKTPELTPRQTQVLQMLADGYRRKQIAFRLQISDWTVKHHLKMSYAKLNVNNGEAAIAEALRMGLIK